MTILSLVIPVSTTYLIDQHSPYDHEISHCSRDYGQADDEEVGYGHVRFSVKKLFIHLTQGLPTDDWQVGGVQNVGQVHGWKDRAQYYTVCWDYHF